VPTGAQILCSPPILLLRNHSTVLDRYGELHATPPVELDVGPVSFEGEFWPSKFWQTSCDESLTMEGMAWLWVWRLKPLFLLVVTTASRKIKAERRFFEPSKGESRRMDKTNVSRAARRASSQNPRLRFSLRKPADRIQITA
jgi:hypothetical protein